MSKYTLPELRVRFHIDDSGFGDGTIQQRIQSVVIGGEVLVQHSMHELAYRLLRFLENSIICAASMP